MKSTLPQHLLRHLKGRLTFMQTEAARQLLSTLRAGLTRKDFHKIVDDLARDLEHYGQVNK